VASVPGAFFVRGEVGAVPQEASFLERNEVFLLVYEFYLYAYDSVDSSNTLLLVNM
jgi:hypothetical protein